MTKQEYKDLLAMKEKLDKQLNTAVARRDGYFMELGRKYYPIMGEDYDPSLKDTVAEIRKCTMNLEKLENSMDELEMRMKEPVDNICPRCGKVMDATAKFCSECGCSLLEQPIPVPVPEPPVQKPNVCKFCGTTLKPDARFCGKCGNPIA